MRLLKLSTISLSLLLAVLACSKQAAPVSVSGVKVSPEKVELEVGGTATLSAEVTPADAADKTVTWASSNPSAVYVKDGKVMALAAGEATVTATTKDGGFKASCTVTVKGTTPEPDPEPENPDFTPRGGHDGLTPEDYNWN